MANTFSIKINNFFQGYSPTHWKNAFSEFGNAGQANNMSEVNVLDPLYLTQGFGLTALTAGTQAGAVDELINYILDKAVTDDTTYGIGATKLQKISSTAVTNTGDFPHTITGATDGESVALLKGNLYYLYNKSSGADIGKFDLSSTFDDDWGSTVPTGAEAVQKAPHPVAVKEDIMLFGNGRYVGVYTDNNTTLDTTKLDFGEGNEVSDIVFHANKWWIAVNSPNLTGSNRSTGQIFVYDGAAISSVLEDETSVGLQRIGFLKVIDGVLFVAYQDLTSTGFRVGYLAGRAIKKIGYFTGSLPLFNQKTLYESTIIYASSGKIYSTGAMVDDLPFQTSQIADGGYGTVGAVSAPFGTPMIASTDGASNHQLAKFSGFSQASSWTSLVFPTVRGKKLAIIDDVIVRTKVLGAGARCDLYLQYNQNTSNSGAKQITTTGKRRHVFGALKSSQIEDFRVYLDWQNGSATNDCAIKEIQIIGHYTDK